MWIGLSLGSPCWPWYSSLGGLAQAQGKSQPFYPRWVGACFVPLLPKMTFPLPKAPVLGVKLCLFIHKPIPAPPFCSWVELSLWSHQDPFCEWGKCILPPGLRTTSQKTIKLDMVVDNPNFILPAVTCSTRKSTESLYYYVPPTGVFELQFVIVILSSSQI